MFSSAPPGSRASSGVMVVVLAPFVYAPLVELLIPLLLLVVSPFRVVPVADELINSLCSCADVTC